VAACLPTRHRHWRRVNPRATASNRKQRDRAQPLLPFLFLHLQKEGKRKQSFGSSSPFRSDLLSSPFGFLFFPSAGGRRL